MLRFATTDLGPRAETDEEQAKVARIKNALIAAGVPMADTYGYVVDAGLVAALNSYLGTTFADGREVVAGLDAVTAAIAVKTAPPPKESAWRSIWITVAGGVAAAVVTGWVMRK